MKERVLLWQNFGFVTVIVISWLSELVDLQSLLFAEHPFFTHFRDSTVNMLLILTIWFVVMRTTRRLLARLRHVEGMMHVCGWCSRVRRDRGWIGVDRFLLEELDTKTSHGICEECCRRQEAALHAPGSATAVGTGTRRPPRPVQARLATVDMRATNSV